MSVEIEGTVFDIIYRNEDNGFVVAIIDHNGEMVYVKGNIPLIEISQKMSFIGEFVVDPKYGEQFNVKASEIIIPKDSDDIEKLLSSGFIDGVGPAYAEKIVKKFGEDTFEIIQYNPEKLMDIRGIGEKKVAKIVDSYYEKIAMKEVVLFLQKVGVSLNYATKIYDYYKGKAIQYINKNPYRLADDIDGIGFKLADQIAKALGLREDSEYRISSGLKYILKQGQYNGHTYLEKDILLNQTMDLLAIEKEKVVEELENLVIKRVLILEKIEGIDVIYLKHLFEAEEYVADKLFRLKDSFIDYDINIEKEIITIDQSLKIQLDELQIKAIEESTNNGVTLITGGPGTGKTTIIKSIIDIYRKNDLKILLAAPTGRAAKRMEEATGKEAKTIHRLLEYQKVDEGFMAFNRTEDNPLIADLIIIDEASMIDIQLMKDLLKAISQGTRLVLVGDANQLPSVGPGNVLEDLLESKYFTAVRLNRIFRQSEKSLIIKNAHKIINGEPPKIDNKSKDFFFISKNRPKEILNEIKSLYEKRLKDFFEVDPLHDVQVLTPMKNYVLGTININKELQSVVNPKSTSKGEKEYFDHVFRVGDKVMQVKNNYDINWVTDDGEQGSGIYNGDIGFIYGIDSIEKELLINFDDEKHIRYPFRQLDELRLSYAVTVHKSQGNEFPIVVIPMGWIPKPLKRRKILYTAITRAEQAIIIIGNINNLYDMVENEFDFERNSGLVYRLKKRSFFYQ